MAHHNAFVRALTKMPQGTAIGVSVGVTCVLSALLTVMFTSKGEKPHTMSPEWVAANKTYMKFQEMNPINGISRGL